jgi:hypothetical protein
MLEHSECCFDIFIRNEQLHTGSSSFQVRPDADDNRGDAGGSQRNLRHFGIDSRRIGFDCLHGGNNTAQSPKPLFAIVLPVANTSSPGQAARRLNSHSALSDFGFQQSRRPLPAPIEPQG